ncbi:type II secretion system protein GspL [Escherichia coli]|uniref:type II secretion system protein GspL n=1 Tax=Escherichia coli TaxID=562 RepID=UPI002889D3D5|nr:type II secretion system protein GspL [Escherichia coli]
MTVRFRALRNVSVRELAPILRQMIDSAGSGNVVNYDPSNVIMLTGRASVVERLTEVIQRVDHAGNRTEEVIPLDNASASEIARVLESLTKNSGENQPATLKSQIVADERTNSVIVSGDPATRDKMRRLIRRLDSEMERSGNSQVFYLKYSKAEDLVDVLKQVSGTLTAAKEEAEGTVGSGREIVSIAASKHSNALIVTAPQDIMQSLQSVIEQLDNTVRLRNIAQWLQENGITRATVAPDWMSIPCGFMACDAQRVICRIDECRGWSAGLALAPVMFRAQLNEQDLPLSLTVVGIAPEKLSAWAGADAERLTVTALPAITTYGEPEGNLLTGPWQPRVSYRKQWARWRVMILPILLILVALAVERGVTLWSVSEQVAQSRTQAEEQFLTLFPEQKRIVNLRSQVTMALKKYRPQADDTRLLAELSAIASTLKSASLSDIEMRGFTFDQKRQILHLQLRAANFASFDKLRSALATDYVVQQDALQKEGDAVSGGVTLRRK